MKNYDLWIHPVRSMDATIGQNIFPIFLNGPWPCLNRIEIRGVRSWRNRDVNLAPVRAIGQYGGRPFDISIKRLLRAAVGPNVNLMVDEPCRTLDDVEIRQ